MNKNAYKKYLIYRIDDQEIHQAIVTKNIKKIKRKNTNIKKIESDFNKSYIDFIILKYFNR